MTRAYAALGAQAIALIPVWAWYIARMTDGSDEPWGLVALITAAALLSLPAKTVERPAPSFWLSGVVTALYAVICPFAPKLVQAAVGVVALGCAASAVRLGARVHFPLWGLLLLSLPVVASLQFYLGYPLRMASAAISAVLLQLEGIPVVMEGTCLLWGADVIAVDAPCSGVRMLWTALYIAFAAAWLYRLGNGRTALLAAAAVVAAVAGNGIRAAGLFHLEAKPAMAPAWLHEPVGVAVFAGMSACIVWMAHAMERSGGPRGENRASMQTR
jgi:exosortase